MNTDRQDPSGAYSDGDDDDAIERKALDPSLGFKGLTTENFLKLDPVMRGFKKRNASGGTRVVSAAEWADEILTVELGVEVPVEIQKLFAVARGAMVYGCLFYPMLALASEQLFRTADASVGHKCLALGAPSGRVSFKDRIDWLIGNGALPEARRVFWHSLRSLRNSTSHPKDQMILMPGQAFRVLQRTAEEIDDLFTHGKICVNESVIDCQRETTKGHTDGKDEHYGR